MPDHQAILLALHKGDVDLVFGADGDMLNLDNFDAIRREDGCLRYDYFLSVQNADEILLVEQWQTEEQQQAHLRAPHMDRLRRLKSEYVADARLGRVHLD